MATAMTPKELLNRLTPETIRNVGKEYGIKLTGKTNTLLSEWVFLGLAALVIVSIALKVSFVWLPALPFFQHSTMGQLLIFLSICTLPFWLAPYFLKSVPKYTLVQGQNIFTGRLHAYAPGLRPKAPWYRVNIPDDYIDTRLIVIEGITTFITKDGVPITYQWTTQGRIHAPLLGLNTRVSLEDMAKSVADVVENVFQKEFLDKPASVLRKRPTIKRIEKALIAALNAPMPEWQAEDSSVTLDYDQNPIWVRFGIVFELITLGAPTFTEDYKQAMTAEAIAQMIMETAKKFIDETKASPDMALNTALIINKENVKRDIFTFEGLDHTVGKALTTAMRVFRKKE